MRIEELSKLLDDQIDNFDLYLERALLYLNEKEYQLAYDDFNILVCNDLGDTEIYNNMAFCSIELFEYEQAVEWFIKAENFSHASWTLVTLMRFEDALKCFENVKEKEYNDYLYLSKCYSNLYKYEEAYKSLDYAISLNPKDPKAYIIRASLSFIIDEHERGIEDLFYVSNMEDVNEETLYQLAELSFDNELYEISIIFCDKAINNNIDAIAFYEIKAAALFSTQQYDSCLQIYYKILEEEEIDYVYSNIGNVFYKMNNVEEAIRQYSIAISLDYENIHYLNSRADFYAELDDYENSLVDLFKVLELNESSNAYYKIANTYYIIKDYSNALSYINNALSLTKDDEYFVLKSKILLDSQEYDLALNAANEAVTFNQTNYKALSIRGWINLHLENYEESEKDFLVCYEENPNTYDSLYDLSCIYIQSGKLEEALGILNKIFKLKLNTITDLFNRSKLYYDLEDYYKAMKGFDQYIKINPLRADVYFVNAKCCSKLGLFNKELKMINKAIKLRQVDEYFKYRFFIHARNNNYKLAVKDMEVLYQLAPTLNNLTNLAECYYLNSNFKKSINCCIDILKVDEKHLNAILIMSDSYVELEQHKKNIEFLLSKKDIIEETHIYYNLGLSYFASQMGKEAIFYLSTVIKMCDDERAHNAKEMIRIVKEHE